jgi:hypothetical protein
MYKHATLGSPLHYYEWRDACLRYTIVDIPDM